VSGSGLLRTLPDTVFVIASALALAIPRAAAAQTGANVLVVINHASSASETIGRRCAERRGVPEHNLCVLPLPVDESVKREVYDAQIEQPIWSCIANRQAQDRILYIVLTKDVPIRISGTSGRSGTNASVDSELTLLYRRRTGEAVPVVGFVPNPSFAGATASATVEPFTHRAHDIYLVTRLDGYTLQDALALIDRAAAPTADGVFVLDKQGAKADLIPNRWLGAAAERLAAQGFYSPNDPLALNNLAYALAVYRNNPEEALPIAQRATVVAREDPTLVGGASIANYYSLGTYRREPLVPYSLDTLAWVQHLLGRHTEATNTIREALAADAAVAPDLRWHAAIIYAAVDDIRQASAELNTAVTADPTLLNRAEIQKLRQQLAARKF
jgi:hypothetical protein